MTTSAPSRLSAACRHALPVLVLFLLALAEALWSWHIGFEYRWTSDTTDTFYRIVRTLPQTSVSAPGGNWFATLGREFWAVLAGQPVTQWYQGLFDAYLRASHLALGDISLAYKIQVFPLTLLFGLGAYLLFLELTGSRWIALALAVAAILPMPLSWAGERSGIGPLWTYTRRYFLTACLPWIAWLYYRGMLSGGRALILAMAATGLASNLHASGIILLQVLVLTWLVAGKLTGKRLLQAGGLLGLALLFSVASMGSLWKAGVAPMLQLLFGSLSSPALASPLGLLRDAQPSIAPEFRYLFYPPKIYEGLPATLVDIWLLASIALSLAPLLLRNRLKSAYPLVLFLAAAGCLLFVSFEQMWVWVALGALLFRAGRPAEASPGYTLGCYLIICNFWVAVVGMLLFQFGYALIDGFPLVFNQLRGIRFMGFWVFAWLAALAAPALPAFRSASRLRWMLWAILGVAVFVTSQTAYRQYFRIQESDRMERKQALLEIAAWARSHTAPDSVFLVGYSSFGVVAERTITHTDKTVRNAGIDWLPPKASKPPAEQVPVAKQYSASHLLLAPEDVSPALQACVLVANTYYALSETRCVEAATGPKP